MDSWEVAFREKSPRRARRSINRKAMKAAILALLFASIAAAIYIRAAGIR